MKPAASPFQVPNAPALIAGALSLLALGCTGARQAGVDSGASGAAGGRAEATWLQRVGSGPAQTARVCARGATDPIARALCGASPAPIGSLAELYGALAPVWPAGEPLIAANKHSVGLSGRIVSPLNPRLFVFSSYKLFSEDQIAAVAFSRGEPFVELVGFDPAANDYNFYLLAFQPTCPTGRCTPADLLTEKVERDWTSWTLYGDADLEDTGLDCLSCHRPDGAGAPKRLLMRQLDSPWMHWGSFPGVSGALPCGDPDNAVLVDATIPADGFDSLTAIAGADGRYGGVPVTALVGAQSGYDFSAFLYYAGGQADGPGDVPCLPPWCSYSEPHPFDSQGVLCDQALRHDRAAPDGAWARYRAENGARGLPVPFHGPDVLDPARHAEVVADRGAFLRANAGADAFALEASLMSAEAARAVGFVPAEEDDAPTIVRQMCVRCHGATTDPRLARSRFDAGDLDGLTPDGAAKVLERISLPESSPELMPPSRAGELPPWARARIAAYLSRR